MRVTEVSDAEAKLFGDKHEVITFGVGPDLAAQGVVPCQAIIGLIEGGAFDGQPRILLKVGLEEEDVDSIQGHGHFYLQLMSCTLPPVGFLTMESVSQEEVSNGGS